MPALVQSWSVSRRSAAEFGRTVRGGPRDFDGDLRHDLLWRHQITGLTFIWFIDGTDRVGEGVVGLAGLDWSVAGTGNFDGQ